MSSLQSTYVDSEVGTFDALVYAGEGHSIVVYPVREQYLKDMPILAHKKNTRECKNINFSYESDKVDFADFIHIPKHLSVEGETTIVAPHAGIYKFRIDTSGAVKLWVNGAEAVMFAPYTRNVRSSRDIEIPLKEGENSFEIYAEDLAERDICFFFAMLNISGEELEVRLNVNGLGKKIDKAEEFLTSCYTVKDCIDSTEDIVIGCVSGILECDTELEIAFGGQQTTQLISPWNDGILLDAGTFNRGGRFLNLTIKVDEYCITRKLLIGCNPPKLSQIGYPNATVEERKAQVISNASTKRYGAGGLCNILAWLRQGNMLDEVREAELSHSIGRINRREDCSDFLLPVVIHIKKKYTPLLTEEWVATIDKAIKNFRYWVDEPGKDVMWYFSENHSLLFHVSQYLGGDIFKEDIFSASGRTGLKQKEIGKQRLDKWFADFFAFGFAEWNSPGYLPVDCIGFFTLYDLAPDAEIRKKAKEALDIIFKVIAVSMFNGRYTNTYGRAYEVALKNPYLRELSLISWITTGEGECVLPARASILYALSAYEPPCYKSLTDLSKSHAITTHWVHGQSNVRTKSYRTADYIMSNCLDYIPFEHGHQQHMFNVNLGEKNVEFFINNPGERCYSGENRPSYWAGNGTVPMVASYKNVTMMVFNIAEHEMVQYVHGYSPIESYDEVYEEYGAIYYHTGKAYLAVKASVAIETVQSGANTNKEIIFNASHVGIVIRAGSEGEFGDFNAFVEAMRSADIAYNGYRKIEFKDPEHGLLIKEHGLLLTINGVQEVVPKEKFAVEYHK